MNNKKLSFTYPVSFNRDLDLNHLYYSLLASDNEIVIDEIDIYKENFTTCDIGCGIGIAPILTGVCNPNINSWGFDYDQQAINIGKRIIEVTQVNNINLVNCTFKKFISEETPDFDIITIHGIYSWITDINKKEIFEIIKSKLKPGGIIYISYNCLNGWSDIAPFRQFIKDYQLSYNISEEHALDNSLELLNELSQFNNNVFPKGSRNKKIFENIYNSKKEYLLHEYMGDEWTLYTFPDVCNDLSNIGLIYLGSADLTRAFDPLHLDKNTIIILDRIDNPIMKESFRDLVMSPMIRRDIFAKGTVSKKEANKKELLLNKKFTLIKPAIQIPHEFNFPLGSISINHDIYNLITSSLSEGAYSSNELSIKDQTIMKKYNNEAKYKILDAIQLLVATNYLSPALNLQNDNKKITNKFNKSLLKLQKNYDIIFPCYASPVTGGGIFRNTDITLYSSLGIEL